MSRHAPSDCKVYVGDLGSGASKQELEDEFGHYGTLRSVWVARNPPGFAFVEFEDGRDAEDAVKALDGRTICGRRARVELSKPGGNRRDGGDRRGGRGRSPPRRGGRPFNSDDRCYDCGERGHYARDCRGGGRRKDHSRSRSRSRDRRDRSRSRSRSDRRSSDNGADKRSRSRSRS